MEKILAFEVEKEDQYAYVDYIAISYQISEFLSGVRD